MTIRLCKILLIFCIAILFTIIAFNNIANPSGNFPGVQHVLKMEGISPSSYAKSSWRAIQSETIHRTFFALIIAWQSLVALTLWLAGARLLFTIKDPIKFQLKKSSAILGLSLGFALYAVVFIAIAGEWFLMWQAKPWDAQPSATMFCTLIGFVLFVILQREEA